MPRVKSAKKVKSHGALPTLAGLDILEYFQIGSTSHAMCFNEVNFIVLQSYQIQDPLASKNEGPLGYLLLVMLQACNCSLDFSNVAKGSLNRLKSISIK